MVTIHKNGTTLEVTRGAYNALFSAQGWTLEKEAKIANLRDEKKSPDKVSETAEKSVPMSYSDGKKGVKEEPHTPLSEMTVAELKKYAKNLGIDTEGLNKKNEILLLIKEEMED